VSFEPLAARLLWPCLVAALASLAGAVLLHGRVRTTAPIGGAGPCAPRRAGAGVGREP